MAFQIKSLFIPRVEAYVTAQYIIDALSNNEIATVSKILIIHDLYPSKYSDEVYNTVYVEIECWHDTEASYSFIKRLRNKSIETRFTHSGTNWWVVKINCEPGVFQNSNTIFNTHKAVMKEDYDYENEEMEAWYDIAQQLFEAKHYQQLELDLCL
jgi:hypothetical protein